MYAMCDKSNAEEIVQEMLNYLETADYSIREEMVSLFQLFLEMAAKVPFDTPPEAATVTRLFLHAFRSSK